MPRQEEISRERRVFRVAKDEKKTIRSLRRKGETNHQMLLRLGGHLRHFARTLKKVEPPVNLRLQLPTETFDILKTVSEKKNIPMVRLLVMTAEDMRRSESINEQAQ